MPANRNSLEISKEANGVPMPPPGRVSGVSLSDGTVVRLLTVTQAASILGCSGANVYALIEAGELAVVQVGRRKGYRIDLRDLAQFVDSRKFRNAGRAPVEQRPARLRHITLH